MLTAVGWTDAFAQFGTTFPGMVQLPREDFTWIWNDLEERDLRRTPDIDVRGYESGFSCQLTGVLRPSSRMSRSDIRGLEQELTTSLAFVQASAQAMNILDQRFELDWARLACEKSEAEVSAEEAEERLDRALEKAIRDRERRRARDRD